MASSETHEVRLIRRFIAVIYPRFAKMRVIAITNGCSRLTQLSPRDLKTTHYGTRHFAELGSARILSAAQLADYEN